MPFAEDPFSRLVHRIRRLNEGMGVLPPVTFCTGRPQPYAEALAKLMDVRLPMICESGAVVYTLKGNVSRYGPGVTGEGLASLRRARRFIEEELLPRHPGTLVQFGKEAHLSVFSEQPELLPPMVEPIEELIRREGLHPLEIKASHFYLNIAIEGVTKGAALTWLLGEQGLDRSQAVGVGDTVGDLALRDAVGYFCCPANAQPEIRDVADYVSPAAETEGMLDILNHLETLD